MFLEIPELLVMLPRGIRTGNLPWILSQTNKYEPKRAAVMGRIARHFVAWPGQEEENSWQHIQWQKKKKEKETKKENQNIMDHRVSASRLSISTETCSVH